MHYSTTHDADDYRVVRIPIDEISPSPENDDLYGAVAPEDDSLDALAESIESHGLAEPLLVTLDHYIVSGHRRYAALQRLGRPSVPCRLLGWRRADRLDEYHALLAAYNPQRVKSVGALLKEALLTRGNDHGRERFERYLTVLGDPDAGFDVVRGRKSARTISAARRPFLLAVKAVIDDMREYWPLSVRQIHYRLLNAPPLKSSPARTSKPAADRRYKNDDASYQSLVRLLTDARYAGEVDMRCIDDGTRPVRTFNGFADAAEFVHQETSLFLTGYQRDRQIDQPRHVEVFGEKATLESLLYRACEEYHVPLNIGRGYCSLPVWRDIARRFRASGRSRMTLVVVSDFDPEGLALADDAVKSLRDLWQIPVDMHRAAVTRAQIAELDLGDKYNPAKETSTQRAAFVQRTGSDKTWEVEALPPGYLIDAVKAAIQANLDMDIFYAGEEMERREIEELARIRQAIADSLQF